MARDKITVDLILATKQADREVARINKNIEKLGRTMGRSFGGASGGGDKVRALGSGLSKATVKADEFSKSMEASNARVIAFGASAGLIMGVDRALRAMVSSAMKVEKAMMDVNVVMGVSNRQLQQFGKGMFKVAKETAQSFDTVAEAATELARQGLGMEKTLARAKDALILTRLTGMKAADAVKSLTAAVNSFNKEGVTSAQIVNRMAKVDAAFAVSSEDLAKSISRVGASAVSAGVNMNELMAITTAVQQRTARGGAVIGNAFKTIFTRIQRTSVQKKLKDFGIASRDMQGNMLGGIKVLQNMADGFDKLTKSQQSSLAESVAGVFQVNILKSALSDLSSQTSNYAGALRTANQATNEAYTRNEQLNQTLDALANKTLANLTKAGAALGGATLEPVIRKILNSVNGVIDAFSEGGQFEDFGKTMGKGLLAGIGNFIAGPGLLIATAAFAKISISLAKFAGTAFKDIMGLNAATKQRVALEEAVIAHIASEPALLAQVRTGTLNVLAVEQDILATIKLSNLERAKMQIYAAPVARALVGRGARVGPKGATMAPPGGAGGFIPNFASPGGERAAAAAGGYRAGSIRTMHQPGAGTMMYNSAETVKRFPGMTQSAIMPPQESPAGAGYRAAFGGAHGFDPYAGRGFVPNFGTAGRPSQGPYGTVTKRSGQKAPGISSLSQGDQKKWKSATKNRTYGLPADDVGVLMAFDPIAFEQKNLPVGQGVGASTLLGLQQYQPLGKQLTKEGAKIKLLNVPFRGYKTGGTAEKDFADEALREMQKSLGNLAMVMMGQLGIEGSPKTSKGLNKSLQGHLFEESMRMAMGAATSIEGAAFDFEANAQPSPAMKKLFRVPKIRRIEAKRTRGSAERHGEMQKKYFNDFTMAGKGVKEIMRQRQMMYEQLFYAGKEGAGRNKQGKLKGPLNQMVTSFTKVKPGRTPGTAGGFVPNFFMGSSLRIGTRSARSSFGMTPLHPSAGSLRKLQYKLPALPPTRTAVLKDMFSRKNVQKVLDKKDALMATGTGRATSSMIQSYVEGTARGLPLSVWVAESIGLYGKTAVTNAVKVLRNVAKKQPMMKGIEFGEGFVPNFSSLSDSIGREMQAGVPASAIRVGSSPALRGAGNPGGVGVFNTIDEPGGLGQGISMSRAGGIDPRTHGASSGFMPNFAEPRWIADKAAALKVRQAEIVAAKKLLEAGDDIGDAAGKQGKAANAMMMAAIAVSMVGPSIGAALGGGTPSGEAKGSGLSNILSMGMMGGATGAMMGGGAFSAPGAAIGTAVGMGVGALSMDWGMAFGQEGKTADAEQAMAAADAIAEGMTKVKNAMEALANIDYMTTEGKITAYMKLTSELNDVQKQLLEGNESTAAATESFIKARKKVGSFQDYQKMGPKERAEFTYETNKLMTQARTRARSTLTAGTQATFEQGLTGGDWMSQSARTQIMSEYSGREGRQRNKSGARKGTLTARGKLSEITQGAFPEELQAELLALPATRGGTVIGGGGGFRGGAEEVKRYNKLIASGKEREAMAVMSRLLGKTEGGKAMSGVLRDALDQRTTKNWAGVDVNQTLTDEDIRKGMGTGARYIPGQGTEGGGDAFGPMQGAAPAAFTLMQMMARGKERADLPFLFPGITDEGKKELTPEQQNKLDLQKAGIGRLQPMIDTARQEGREAGYDAIRGKGTRRRELAGGTAERANEKRLNAVTMFGEGLINATRDIEQAKLEQQQGLKEREIEDGRRTKLAGDLAKAEEKYLTAIRDAKIGEEQRTKAEGTFDVLADMKPQERLDRRNELRKDQFRSTVEGKELEALDAIIAAEIETREKARVSLGELGKDFTKNKDVLDSSTKAQKKLLEETKKFRPERFLDAIKTEKSILIGRIALEKQMVEEGRLLPAVLRKSINKLDDFNNKLGETHDAVEDFYRKPLIEQAATLGDLIKQQEIEVGARRLNIRTLEENKIALEQFKDKIDGTGNVFGEILSQIDRSMGTPLTGPERKAAETGAATDFRDLMRSRQDLGVGESRLLGTGRPEDAFKQGLITGDEYRDIRKKARLGKGGNPMEAFHDQFKYGNRDAMLEIEDGMTNVAKNMKSSFADAFQSIASGANTVQGALANMAQSILNSISSISANMMTDMLFSKWKGANGGLVPGYAGGGVVSGGSGYKDDVPTMMQGGEFVIKKSSAQKIGYGKLNAINGYAEGGPTKREGPGMGTMAMVSMGASALSGVIGAATQPGSPKPLPSRDYGLGKGKYGYFGGADPDAGQVDTVTGGGGRAGVSLGKGFVYYRRDPETGRLISERARPTEGRFEVSRGLSLMGRLGEDDPQTGRMFGKEQSMAKYQDYLIAETKSRKDQIDAVKKQKKQRLIGAYMNAAMMIGGAKWMQGQQQAADLAKQTGGIGSTNPEMWGYMKGQDLSGLETSSSISRLGGSSMGSRMGSVSSWSGQGYSPYIGGAVGNPGASPTPFQWGPSPGATEGWPPGPALGGYQHYANGGSASGTPAMVMGGEYIMSPETVRTYGSNFMHELNRGNVPSYANGGPTGGASAGNQGPHSETLIGGNTTNNVKISVNIDKAGKADASADAGSGGGGGGEREDNEQANQSKEFGKILQGVVLDEIVKQQRPGGLLQGSPHTP